MSSTSRGTECYDRCRDRRRIGFARQTIWTIGRTLSVSQSAGRRFLHGPEQPRLGARHQIGREIGVRPRRSVRRSPRTAPCRADSGGRLPRPDASPAWHDINAGPRRRLSKRCSAIGDLPTRQRCATLGDVREARRFFGPPSPRAARPEARDCCLTDECERAPASAATPAYDGRFFTGIRTTKVYCRPVCPVRPGARRQRAPFSRVPRAGRSRGLPTLLALPAREPRRFSPAWRG